WHLHPFPTRRSSDLELLRRVARILVDFHRRALTGPGVNEFGGPANLAENWRENFEQVAPYVGVTISAVQLKAIERSVELTFAERSEEHTSELQSRGH